jgi:hypothetical protein
MKKTYLLLLAIGLLLVAVAIAGVDFSGTWALNADKTAAANPAPAGGGGGGGGGGRGGGGRGGFGGGDMVITQTGNDLTISRTMGQNAVETKYTMDGADHTNSTQMGDVKYKAVLNGSTLTVTGTRTTQRGESPLKEEYTLSADGKMLTVATTRTTQNGEMVTKAIYDKK